MRWLTADYRGHPRWMLGADARGAPGHWLLAAVVLPLASWILALAVLPLLPLSDHMWALNPIETVGALAAAPATTWLMAYRRDDRSAFVHATLTSMYTVTAVLLAVGSIATVGLYVWVTTSWPGG